MSQDVLSTNKGEVQRLNTTRSSFTLSEERFRLLVESVSDYAIFLLDATGIIQSWNPGAQRFKGYTSEEAIGKHFSIFYTVEDIRRGHPQYELRVASEIGRFEEEGWRVKKDGSRFWASVVITRLTSPDGTLVGFAKVTRDLTERKLAQEELRLSEERHRFLIEAVRDYAIFMLDPEGKITTWNEGARRLKGYSPQEIIGKHFSCFYLPEDVRAKKPDWGLEEAVLTGRFEDEGWRLRKDGTRFWANVVICPIRNSQGYLMGFSKVTRDMTERRRLEEKLRRTNEELDERVRQRTAELEKAIRARDEFIGIVSHELRTPVTSMKLQVQTAIRQLSRRDSASFLEKASKFVMGAEKQLDRLAKLIDDMLDVSRISMDRLVYESTDIDLNHLVREVAERFEEQLQRAGCSITVEDTERVIVRADRHRIEQVLANLLINASKYGAGHPISIRIGKRKKRAVIEIQDRGIGIAEEDHLRIFDRFERAVSASTVSGLGLGLYISRKIVEAHNGEISVESQPGKGSTFRVLLPL